MSEGFTLIDTTQGNPSIEGLPFEAMKNEVLGENYELELIFLDEKEMHDINLRYHAKDKPTNILSFPLSETTGQIFICPTYAKKEAPDFDRTFENYIAFLFIHGLIHLKGYDHGSRMESEEQKIRKIFGI